MADLTPGRKPVDESARHLKRRRVELDIQVLKTDILRKEIEIEERHDQIVRAEEEIRNVKKRIGELEQLLADGTSEQPTH
ncbi:MAG: hypothetical protein ACRESL_27245 [Pseudomonas sp.]